MRVEVMKVEDVRFYDNGDKNILLIGSRYRGSPMIMCKYDVLIGPKHIINQHKDRLIPSFFRKRGWQPKVIYL